MDEIAFSVVQTEDLGYALCGSGWLLKTDSQGNVQWSKTYGQLRPFRVIKADDGGYAIIGSFAFDNDVRTPVLMKTDENGNLLWNKTFSLNSYLTSAGDVVETDGGDYVVAGIWGGDFWLAKTDNGGNLLWNQTYNHVSGAQIFRSIAKTGDGGFILSGDGGGNAWLIKTDFEGEEIWSFNYTSSESISTFHSAVELVDGGYIAVGYFNSRALLVRTDASGVSLWNSAYGEDYPYEAFSVIAPNDGGFVVAGSLDNNVWLAKFAPESQFWSSVVLLAAGLVTIAVVSLSLLHLKKRKP